VLECDPLQGSCGAAFLFPPLSKGLKFLLFDGGAGTFLQSWRGVLGLCALWEAGFLATAE
jgi:hypothetical protein